ncbi:MAG: DnaA regulatory inactivator Hda [Gammaproteobacteria bacterium]|nr:DnaA regulatory inactivator Hda [Gammaproteobacteria bacterium]
MAWQLALGLKTDDFPTFEAFVAGGNREAVTILHDLVIAARPGVAYIWGPAGSGKTHLLQAACVGGPAAGIYLPLAELAHHGVGLLDGLESRTPLCLDDIGTVAGDGAWEEALFHLFNRAQSAGALVVMAGRSPPRGLGIRLPDLLSRLVGGLGIPLRAPTDEELVEILRAMTARRGMRVADDVLGYLLSRERRELGYLAMLVERLDRCSLASQRRVTIPFIKEVLDASESS